MNPRLLISKKNKLVDEDIKIKVNGIDLNKKFKIEAKMKDDFNRIWKSYASFISNSNDEINLNDINPIESSYKYSNSNDLLWSMKLLDNNINFPPMFLKNNINTYNVIISLIIDNKVFDNVEVTVNFTSSDIKKEEISNPIVGKFFTKKKLNKSPGVIVLGGSNGGIFWSEQIAALLSNKGYSCLALNYFDFKNEELPSELIEIKLEYFYKAINYMKNHSNIDENKISIVGISKGGEASLLLGSYFSNEINSIVSYVPSSNVFEGISMDKHPRKSSWSFKNKPLDYIKFPKYKTFSMDMNLDDIKKIHDKALIKATKDETNNSRIKVEKINCPILMISGEKDNTWSSKKMCTDMIRTIEKHDNPYQSIHLNYKNMGHTFFLPNIPPIINNPAVKIEDAAKANIDSWKKVLNFLSKY